MRRDPPPIRNPVQHRALLRRESILDATARILDQVGYDGLTTNAVALEAGTAIGTVYQYFRNREALLDGLLERHGQRLRQAIDKAIASGGSDFLQVADDVVDAFARVWRKEPGYRAAWSAKQVDGLLTRTGAAWSDAFTEHVADILGTLAPTLQPSRLRVVARTAVHLVSGLLLSAMAGPRRAEKAMVAETKVALHAYLALRLEARDDAPLPVKR